ncbi:hypothetical protein PG984_004302 [Apiospora sp. TS-2023a]
METPLAGLNSELQAVLDGEKLWTSSNCRRFDWERPSQVSSESSSVGVCDICNDITQCYRPDKFTRNGHTLFKTGDLYHWLDNGEIEPLGRKDGQVKISGVRI